MIDRRRLRRVAGKPPGYLLRRAASELTAEGQRLRVARAARGRGPLSLDRILPAAEHVVLQTTAASCQRLGAWAAGAEAVRRDQRLRNRLEQRASAATEGSFELFGDERLSEGSPPRWLEDVRSGHGWAPGWHRRIDYRNLDRPSDVKVAWELSRLRHLVALAQWAAVSGTGAPDVLERDLRDWCASNPAGWTVNWSSAMEVALRAVNLVCVDAALLTAGDASLRPLLTRMLYQHGWFLDRNLEISDVNGNHYLADAVGLVWLGLYFDGLGEAPRWLDRGRDMVLSAARWQVLEDGLCHEGSVPYHVLVLELFLAARAVDPRLSPVDPTLVAMTRALEALVGPEGRVPDIGDDDGGRALALCDAPSRDARRVLALAGRTLGDEAALESAGNAWPEDALWLLGSGAGDAAPGPRTREPSLFRAGGLAVLGAGADRVVADVGPVGFRGRGGHGHLDAMSFEAILGGRIAVRDSGTGSYTGDPALREELRDAPAHSVALVDGRRYARLGGAEALWRIEGDSRPEVIALEGDASKQRLRARQLLPAAAGTASHDRTLSWSPGELEVADVVHAPAGAAVEAFLQLPADVELAGSELRGAGHRYVVELPRGATLELLRCRASPAYGTVTAARRARVAAVAGDAPIRLTWRIIAL